MSKTGDTKKTKAQLATELAEAHRRIAELEASEAECRRVEEALRESQKFSSSLLEHSPHSILVINPDTSIEYANPTFLEVNGWTAAEVIGMKAPYPWWPEEAKEELCAGFKEAMKVGIQSACEVNGVASISAGNYGGRLGSYNIHLRELFS